ncbi:MAG: bifunctional 4-hydroxy-2-oxoglutarate aldolase/2-dehydro-3-deoxy-phosphogluconate aldolase [Chloroflexota bacterium]|nr:MAG: bifunctional 4-hydroxy-2-oxoglutarate aldolase/2-dehydro-3-deoxy-phosphogluconate aldolase [Chloroflexota bacterium]
MNALERIGMTGVVPVVVIDEKKNAHPTAQALLEGGVDVMEITLRTKAGLDSIQAVASACPDMLVGAGTVVTLDQCKACVDAGAQFIVSPGFNRTLVEWCIQNQVATTPGCVTPTEIMQALELGIRIIKFFPANVFGGLPAMKALAAPFGDVKFIPTGGINGQNLAEYVAAPFVYAAGGSWLCDKADIASNNFEKIRSLCIEAVQVVHHCRKNSRS